ncbi:hypothetical protein FACS189447_04000 [Spirochaetia bacterium]|nr:hypothetical protein FACS189447_04000 [Spirochaetia bacterium]
MLPVNTHFHYTLTMLRRFVVLLICLFPLSLQAQEDQASLQENKGSTFPLALIMEASRTKTPGTFWGPDWSPGLPPDAFKAQNVSGIIFYFGDTQYKAQWDDQGLVRDFPFFLEGELVQVSVEYNPPQIAGITLAFQAGDSVKEPLDLEILEYAGDDPSIIRVKEGDVYSFVLMRWGMTFILEAWYDEDGNALAEYEYQVSTEPFSRIKSYKRLADQGNIGTIFDYDSRSLVTGISGPGGNFSVHYFHGDLPRYWEQAPDDQSASHYSLQWDENGFLVRASGAVDGSDEILDSRYEYDFDSRGNWTSRREIKMVRRFGLLSPVQGPEITRMLEYRGDE